MLALSPQQPRACGNNHALPFFVVVVVLIWKYNSIFVTNMASLWLGKFPSLKPSWSISRLWRAGWKGFGSTVLRKGTFYLRCYFLSVSLCFSPHSHSRPEFRFIRLPCSCISCIILPRECFTIIFRERREGSRRESFPCKCIVFALLFFSVMCVPLSMYTSAQSKQFLKSWPHPGGSVA